MNNKVNNSTNMIISKNDIEINRKHEIQILDAIENNPIFFFDNIFVYYKGCSRATAYNHNLDKLDTIKEALYNNRRQGVSTLLNKWIESNNATLQIAAMRLLCNLDERQMLSQSYIDHTTKGKSLTNIEPLTKEEIQQRAKQISDEI